MKRVTIGSVVFNADGSTTFQITASGPSSWRIETSPDAAGGAGWTPLGPGSFESTETISVSDPRAASAGSKTRLHRLVKE
ncbi:MAG TPA: hypothetical protein VGR78_07745 [Verrucomicrobiae bacterium]|nr:hypothetical protein [Verrucomicrobiae bacterium]